MSTTIQKRRRRYYLHYRIRKSGFHLYTRLSTIALPALSEPSAHMLELRDKFHYSIQYTLI